MLRYVGGEVLSIAIGFSTLLYAAATIAGDATPKATALTGHLAAGEFGPARAIAQSLSDPLERDAQLAAVAQAQLEVGARAPSLATIGLIGDEHARAAAIDEFGGRRGNFPGAAGGVQADFDSLIDLITSTVAPTTWDEVGGNGSIAPFESGVRVDAAGLLKRVERKTSTRLTALVKAEQINEREVNEMAAGDYRRDANLRKVSLPRLERAVQLSLAAGRAPTEEMRYLAGLEKIRYVLVYPQTGDIVLAGPAGDWRLNAENRLVGLKSGRPILQIDDFAVILRHLWSKPEATFGCAITPTQDGLARTRKFAEESSKSPLKPGGREAWLAKLRDQLGRQTIDVMGIDPRTRAARVLVEADYRMKLVGMGLEDGTLGVESYLDSLQVGKHEAPPPLDVLRWWFTMNYQAIVSTPDRDGFELRGQGVQVQCENEIVNGRGERIHTGKASALNQGFAQSFTEHFAALAKKYPVYADMQNLFDIALVVALIRSEGLDDRVGWHALCLGDEQEYPVALGVAPKQVDTVMNHRVVNDKYVVVGVSGGVRVDPWSLVNRTSLNLDTYGKLKAERAVGTPRADLEVERWWWD